MLACYIKGCKIRTEFFKKNNAPEKIHFYGFPKNAQYIEKWKTACGRENINIKNAKVCSVHFSPSAFKEKSWINRQLGLSPTCGRCIEDNAVPTEKLPCIITSFPLDTVETTSNNDPSTLTMHSVPLDDVVTQHNEELLRDNKSILSAQPEDLPTTSIIVKDAKEKEEEHELEEKCTWKEKYEKLKKENMTLQRKLRMKDNKIKKADHAAKKYMTLLKRLFTPGQVHLLLHPEKTKTKWNAEDITAAVSLRSVSLKAYRFFRNTTQIPLPSLSTLRKWVNKLDMEQGPIHDVLSIMKQKGSKMTIMQKLTVLCFDEIYLSNLMNIDRKKEQKIGPHRT